MDMILPMTMTMMITTTMTINSIKNRRQTGNLKSSLSDNRPEA